MAIDDDVQTLIRLLRQYPISDRDSSIYHAAADCMERLSVNESTMSRYWRERALNAEAAVVELNREVYALRSGRDYQADKELVREVEEAQFMNRALRDELHDARMAARRRHRRVQALSLK